MNLRDQLRRKFALQNIDNNTFIGGVAALIPDAAAMATVLNIPVSDIKNYKINGKDVSFRVLSDYTLTSGAFSSASGARGDAITYYFDLGGRVVNTSGAVFSQFQRANPSKILFFFPSLTFISNTSFQLMQNAVIAMKLVTPIGINALDNDVFVSTNNLTLFTNNANATNNGGNPDGDIVELLANNGNVTYITDTTNPDSITNISLVNIGATYVDITFDLATHVNNYLYVIAVVNGVSIYLNASDYRRVYALNINSKNSFQLLAVDEYFNVSPLSRKRTFLTASLNPLFNNTVAYYKLDETSGNAIDVVNGYNGTLFGGVTQGVAGIIGTAYSFDGSSGYIDLGDNDDFSFTDGTNDTPFTIRAWVKLNSTATQMITGKAETAKAEYYFRIAGGKISLQLFSQGDQTVFLRKNTVSDVNTGSWTHIVATYDGSNIKIYQNALEETITDASSGTYLGMSNTNTSVQVSRNKFVNSQFIDGDLDELTIIKGEAWNAGQVSDDYNNGSGTTI